jgi:inhibitor of cysteine peptidase
VTFATNEPSAIHRYVASQKSLPVNQLTLTQEQNGQTVKTRSGNTFIIQLPENPTTGYRWSLLLADSSIVELVSDEVFHGSSTIGSGGQRRLTFRAKNIGSTQLKLSLFRPWEGRLSSSEEYHITLVVISKTQ